jgi:RNA polymerase sigma-70 factor (ECF subfamily)
MKNLLDLDLLALMQRDDHTAFDVLFDRYWSRLYRAAHARLNDADTAQDIVQEIFIKLWQRRATVKIKGEFENYLQGAVRLSVISHYRSKKATEVQLTDALERVNMLESSMDSLTDYVELERTLQQAIEVMPEMLKRVYQLRSDNLPVKVIAAELGLADQTVKNYIVEVLRRLRIVIAERYPEKHLSYMALIIAALYK